MTKTELNTAVKAFKSEIKVVLQTVYDALNQGQQKQLIKDEAVKNFLIDLM